MQRLSNQPNQTPHNLYNPSRQTFVFTYEGQDYELPGFATKSFPEYIARRLASALADFLVATDETIKNRLLAKEQFLHAIYL